MKCSKCGLRLVRARDGYKTQTNTTEIERVEQWCCANPNCEQYAGNDLNDPKIVEKRTSEILQSVNF